MVAQGAEAVVHVPVSVPVVLTYSVPLAACAAPDATTTDVPATKPIAVRAIANLARCCLIMLSPR